MDIDSRTVLFEKNSQEKRQIASISKLITAIIILENHRMDETVTVSKNASQVEGRKVGLSPGEKILLENLMYGLLIHSGNDAAIALAEHDAGNVDAFVQKMNEEVKTLGLKNTHFSNPAGLDDEKNFSTANDVALFALEALDQPFIRDAAQIKEKEIFSIDSKLRHRLETTDDLLKDPLFPIKGLKTGNTLGAGPSFVGFMEKDGHRILTVILGSEDRFKDTKILLDWVLRAYTW